MTRKAGKRVTPVSHITLSQFRFIGNAPTRTNHESRRKRAMEDGYLKSKEAAQYLSMSIRTFKRWAKDIPYFKVGAQPRYRKADIDAFMESRRVEPRGPMSLKAFVLGISIRVLKESLKKKGPQMTPEERQKLSVRIAKQEAQLARLEGM